MNHAARAKRWDWLRLGLFMLVAVAFGAIVEVRGAYLSERRTDLNVYLRAAWAVKVGEDPYAFVTKADGQYNYPPLMAILLTPFADNPLAENARQGVPFEVSVAFWYVLSVLALLWAVHHLASALEQAAANPGDQDLPRRRWRLLRWVSILVCLPGIGRTLALGQVDLFVLALLCGTIAAAVRRQSLRAGMWLGGAICVKFLPIFLLIFPIWRRDRRWLVGCLIALALGWGLIPTLYFGPAESWQLHRRWVDIVILPGAGVGQDESRQVSLTSLRNVNSQSLAAIFHNWQYPDRPTQPHKPGTSARTLALALGALLLLANLAAIPANASLSAVQVVLALGTLINVMLLCAPVCHPHYFCHWIPLTMGLVARQFEKHPERSVSLGLKLTLALNLVANALTSLPSLSIMRDMGLATFAGLLLWTAGVRGLWWCKQIYWLPLDLRMHLMEHGPVGEKMDCLVGSSTDR